MTIAVVVRVNDGIVLASDSATTLARSGPNGDADVVNIYNNANKTFNLYKGLPLAAMTWGQGNIGPQSIATLTKDFRRRISGENPRYETWKIDPENYSMSDVAEKFKEFMHDEKYHASRVSDPSSLSELGLFVGGYGSGEDQPQLFELQLTPAACVGPVEILTDPGASWWGQPEAITRLMLGISGSLPTALVNLGVDPTQVDAYVDAIKAQVSLTLVQPAMPIQDAIDLAYFLVELTIKFVRFTPGHQTVGGPVEVAAITKHEGFRWVHRKHYFDATLNGTGEGQCR